MPEGAVQAMGDAVRSDSGMGSATRNGSGGGDAIRLGDGRGDAHKHSAGVGSALRSGDGDGDAVAHMYTANKVGKGKGLAKVLCEPGCGSYQHEHTSEVVEVSVLDPATDEYAVVARYDGCTPSNAELQELAEDHYFPDAPPSDRDPADVVRTAITGSPASWTQRA